MPSNYRTIKTFVKNDPLLHAILIVRNVGLIVTILKIIEGQLPVVSCLEVKGRLMLTSSGKNIFVCKQADGGACFCI